MAINRKRVQEARNTNDVAVSCQLPLVTTDHSENPSALTANDPAYQANFLQRHASFAEALKIAVGLTGLVVLGVGAVCGFVFLTPIIFASVKTALLAFAGLFAFAGLDLIVTDSIINWLDKTAAIPPIRIPITSTDSTSLVFQKIGGSSERENGMNHLNHNHNEEKTTSCQKKTISTYSEPDYSTDSEECSQNIGTASP